MEKPAARQGDTTAHGGMISVGCATVLIGGKPAARLTDMHTCPMQTPAVPPIPHVGGPITGPGAPTVLIGGMPAAVVGDMAVCTGPPDTIIPPGCPTVLIGTGGGGGAGAGTGSAKKASATGTSSDTEETHKLDIKFVDNGGKPISGVNYTIKNPDGQKETGLLSGRIKKSGVKKGNYEIELKAITSAKWSVKDARVGDVVKLKAEVSGFKSGTEAEFRIYEKDFSSADDLIATVEAKTSGDKVEAKWEYKYVEDTDDIQSEEEKRKGYSLPEYYFIVQIEDSMCRSNLLKFKDYVEINLKDANGNGIPNAAFLLYFSNGEIKEGQLDSNGYKKVENIPPGEWSVSFPDVSHSTKAEETKQSGS